ncbi:flippase [Natrinema versiforme]|uniref:Membrane protein involved in the export of O-antigen and teichoic acid n=1 Tax=Natrinema versiforme JCM 10478 TaxID=1227496 RepID=L9XPX0_9EURY|nr:flippase [Natrinema versiforme]ELY63471.1 membrane protein involved in the export of O-antigen and teichoic acid [Natrinema versiforme JCM 10478]
MNIGRSSLKLFAAQFGSSILQFLGIAYFARVLGPSPLGVFFLFQALLGMLAIPANFGLSGAVEKRISEGKSQGAYLSSAIVLKITPLILIVVTILLFQSLINNYLGDDLAILLAVAIILQEASQLSIAVLKGELRVGETAILQVTRQIAWVGVGTAFVSLGFGSVALIYGLLTGLCLVLVWGWYKVSIIPDKPSREHAHSLIEYSKYNAVSSIGGYFYNWMDVAIIGLFLTQAHVGAYEIAWRVTSIVILLSRSIATTIFPQISKWDSKDAQDRIEDLLPQVLTPSLILVIPAFFGTVVLSEEILGLLFGSEYTIASLALIILMFDQVTEAGQVVLGRSLQAVNRPDLAARATVAGVVINLGLNLALVKPFGITGAAVATMIASLISGLLLHGFYLSQIVPIKIPSLELASCAIAAVGMTILIQTVIVIVGVGSIAKLLIMVALGAVIYTILLFSSPRMRTKMKIYFETISTRESQ